MGFKHTNISDFRRRLKSFGFVLIIIGLAMVARADEIQIAHNIQIELSPAENKLTGMDDMTIQSNQEDVLEFRLSKRISKLNVTVNGRKGSFDFDNERLRLKLDDVEKSGEIQVSVRYTGIFDDPVPIRPLNTDNPGFGVSGSITETGSFLLAGAGWYPELAGGRATYRLKVRAPAGTIAVTAGRSLGHVTENGRTTSEWEVNYPVRGLSLSAARYIVTEKAVGKVTAATYFLSQNETLATSYLEATSRYLSLYSDLFGPYPFEKFAVVENFFPTGFGFPSYTLLGGTVLRLPFIIYTSLGHEIAHCWWGNGVYVDYAGGNWCEGLTTYVADYLYKEMKSEQDALDYRRQWLRNFSTLVRPENDFALVQFQSRYDSATKTIGYDKCAMIFHMLRRLLGEEAFWGALRDIYRDRLFQQTAWTDLQHAFEIRGKCSLQDFFDLWVYRKGAPQFFMDAVQAERSGNNWKVVGQIVQQKPFYHFPLTLALETRSQKVTRKIEVIGPSTSFELVSNDLPRKLTADPDYEIMRRLYPSEIPPAINSLKSSTSVLFVLSDPLDPDIKKSAETLALSLGLDNYSFATEREVDRQKLLEHDILVIGRPRQKDLLQKMPGAVTIGDHSFILNTAAYDESSDTFFGVFQHPYVENRVAALFMPLSPRYADIVAGKITHYGKYSYLVFQHGENREKGFWPVETSPLIYDLN
jgi:hypothetical protein